MKRLTLTLQEHPQENPTHLVIDRIEKPKPSGRVAEVQIFQLKVTLPPFLELFLNWYNICTTGPFKIPAVHKCIATYNPEPGKGKRLECRQADPAWECSVPCNGKYFDLLSGAWFPIWSTIWFPMRSRFNFHCLLRIWREGKKKLQQVFKSNSYSGQRQPATIFSFIWATINHRLSFRLDLPLLLKCKIEEKITFFTHPIHISIFLAEHKVPKKVS